MRAGLKWDGSATPPKANKQISKEYPDADATEAVWNVRACGVEPGSPFLLIVRLYWGWQFIETGWGKLGDLGKVTNYFTSLGIPAPALNAYFISGLEFAGGILLAIGLGSRVIALMLAVDMAFAYYLGDHDALLAFFSDPDKFYAAAPFTFLVASLIVLIFGSGKLALDALIVKRLAPRPHPTHAPVTV